MDDIDLHYDRVVALRGRYLGPCGCHLSRRSHDGEGGVAGDLPDPGCPKCGGEGELYACGKI